MHSLITYNLKVLIEPVISFDQDTAVMLLTVNRAYLKALNIALVIDGCIMNKIMIIVDTILPSCSSLVAVLST